MKITTELLMSWKPCRSYTREIVSSLLGDGKTPLEICDGDIPGQDCEWVLLRPEIIPEPELHELACKFAEHALLDERKSGREPDLRSWAAIEAKRKWLRKQITDEQLAAVRAAAWAAAWAAVGAAVRAAARAAEIKWQLAEINKVLIRIER